MNREALHPSNSGTPNWPRVINYDKFSHYCGPVQLAVLSALEKHPEILTKVRKRTSLSTEEQETLQTEYANYGAMIRMRKEMLSDD